MKTKIILYCYLLFIGLTACNKDEDNISLDASLKTISFLKDNNPSLSTDLELEIVDNKIKGNVPLSVSLDGLIATFDYTGDAVKIGDVQQISGTTTNNYLEILTYSIVAENGTSNLYEADITRFTGLPLVFITTDNGIEIDTKDEYRTGDVEIIGRGFEDLNVEMKIRGRGNSTWWIGENAKRPYQMKLSDKAEVLGMPKDKKWIFLAEYSDKTLMRNRIGFEFGYLSNLDWTPSSTYAEVIVNGKYDGTYHITQKVEESSNRVNIGDNGYLLEIDQLHRLDDDDIFFYSSKFLINIKEPKLEKDDVAYNHIKNYISDFETALYGNNFKDPNSGYAKYIDINSFIDWYLINEIVKNQDARSFSSIYMNIIPGEKLKMGPLWDFDLGFGNVDYDVTEHPTGFWIKLNPWLKRMFEDPSFTSKVKERFAYYRANEAHIIETIDKTATYLDQSQYENDQVWHTLGIRIWPNPVWFDTYKEEVDHLKEWLTTRMNWLDANL